MHEIGHNAGLQHAAAAGQCDTCDPSSPLGSWGSLTMRCYDAPQVNNTYQFLVLWG